MADFLFMLFGIGTWGFNILTLVAITTLFVCVEYELEGKALLDVVIYSILIWYSNGAVNIWEWLTVNGIDVLKWTGVYLVVGVLWAVLKIGFKGRAIRHTANKYKEKFIINTNDPNTPELQLADYYSRKLHRKEYEYLYEGPEKSVVVMWMMYWPISSAWTILNDPVKKLLNMLYDVCKSLFNKIHMLAIGDATKIN